MQVKIQKSYRYIVAICDSELVGKYFDEEEFQLDLKESFYKGEEKSKDETLQIIKDMSKEDATFNIVGEEAIQTALEAEIISEDSIRKIKGIPFSMVLL